MSHQHSQEVDDDDENGPPPAIAPRPEHTKSKVSIDTP